MTGASRGTRHRFGIATVAVALATLGSLTILGGSSAPSNSATADCGQAETLQVAGRALCTHGDDRELRTAGAADDEPDAADLMVAAGTASSGGALATRAIPCHGDGTSGDRIAFYYGYLAGHANRVSSVRAGLVAAIERANDIVYRSARETGGTRWLRVVTDSLCRPIITAIRLPAKAARSFGDTVAAAQSAHLVATNRKYVLFVDTDYYCGLGTLTLDDHPGVMNRSNVGPSWARVDRGCWSGPTAAHEIFHMLGAVQKSAPHYDGTGHCTDDRDLMCYQNPGGRTLMIRCAGGSEEDRLDCGKDDYFSTAPRRGSYLAAHWNTAQSAFLYGGGPARPNPPARPTALRVSMTSLERATITWSPPSNSRVTSYVVTRDDTVVQRGAARSYTDLAAVPGQTSYRVQAVNEAGVSPGVTVTAVLPLPAAPSVHPGADPTTITWTADTRFTAGFAFYGVESNGTLVHLADPAATARSAADWTMFLFRAWTRYRLCAVNATGQRCADAS